MYLLNIKSKKFNLNGPVRRGRRFAGSPFAESAGPDPVLPLSAPWAAACFAAFNALEDPADPARNAPAPDRVRLPGAVAQALRMLGDDAFRQAAELARSARSAGKAYPCAGAVADAGHRERRRSLLRDLQRRYPEGVSAIRAACGGQGRQDGEKIIIVSVFTHLIIITAGELRCFENPFDGADPAN